MNQKVPLIRVLIVDDSSFMRNTLSTLLKKRPDVQVVGTAKNGREAILQVQEKSPDVMTLDVDMPGMDGLDVLDYVMAHHPLPVIMISALTKEGAVITLQALERGAVSFIPKDFGNVPDPLASIEERIYEKVQEAYQAKARVHNGWPLRKSPSPVTSALLQRNLHPSVPQAAASCGEDRNSTFPCGSFPVVVIGSSTGGPNLLKKIIGELPEHLQALFLIIQHMPKFFTKVFSESLHDVAPFPVREARHEDPLEPGIGLVAPGDQHLSIMRRPTGQAVIHLSSDVERSTCRPSIDRAMTTAAEVWGPSVIGVVLSGMGNDGVEGCQHIKAHGGTVVVQDEATALMYGMPRAVMEAGWADIVAADGQLTECLIRAIEALQGPLAPFPVDTHGPRMPIISR